MSVDDRLRQAFGATDRTWDDQVLEHCSRSDPDHRSVDSDVLGRVAQHDARKSAIVRDQIRTTADQGVRGATNHFRCRDQSSFRRSIR